MRETEALRLTLVREMEVIHARRCHQIAASVPGIARVLIRDPEPARSGLVTSLTLAAMSLGYGVVQLDVTIVNTALNSIGGSLGGGVSQLQWVVSAYTIAFAAFILTAGALGDRIGAKRIFIAGFAIFTAASVGCALAPNAGHPDRGESRPGTWRGDSGAELAGAAQPCLSG